MKAAGTGADLFCRAAIGLCDMGTGVTGVPGLLFSGVIGVIGDGESGEPIGFLFMYTNIDKKIREDWWYFIVVLRSAESYHLALFSHCLHT